MAAKGNFIAKFNDRKSEELVLKGEFIAIEDLKLRPDIKGRIIYEKYLFKEIPDYPSPIEFHISEVVHVTNKYGLPLILKDGGFKGNENLFSWWHLNITEAEITAAEERFLEGFLQDLTKEERAVHESFLNDYATSPLFQSTSRYGNFRFTFPITDLMEAYQKQICDGEKPILRIFGTKLFKQEIEYVIVVHSPQCDRFAELPQLASNKLVAYDENKIIWKAQAICETHFFQLRKHDNKVLNEIMDSHQFYVWDQVSIAFYLEGDKTLVFPKESLQNHITCCEIDPNVNLSKYGSLPSLAKAKEFLSEKMQK